MLKKISILLKKLPEQNLLHCKSSNNPKHCYLRALLQFDSAIWRIKKFGISALNKKVLNFTKSFLMQLFMSMLFEKGEIFRFLMPFFLKKQP